MTDKIQTFFTSTVAVPVTRTGEERVRQMMRLIDELDSTTREDCRQCMLALMQYHGKDPATHVMFLNVNDIPGQWRDRLPEFVRPSNYVPSGQAYLLARASLTLFGIVAP